MYIYIYIIHSHTHIHKHTNNKRFSVTVTTQRLWGKNTSREKRTLGKTSYQSTKSNSYGAVVLGVYNGGVLCI